MACDGICDRATVPGHRLPGWTPRPHVGSHSLAWSEAESDCSYVFHVMMFLITWHMVSIFGFIVTDTEWSADGLLFTDLTAIFCSSEQCAWVPATANRHMIEISFQAAIVFFWWVPWIKWLSDGKSFVLMMMASLAVESRGRSGDGKNQMTSGMLILRIWETLCRFRFCLLSHDSQSIFWSRWIRLHHHEPRWSGLVLEPQASRQYLVLWKACEVFFAHKQWYEQDWLCPASTCLQRIVVVNGLSLSFALCWFNKSFDVTENIQLGFLK